MLLLWLLHRQCHDARLKAAEQGGQAKSSVLNYDCVKVSSALSPFNIQDTVKAEVETSCPNWLPRMKAQADHVIPGVFICHVAVMYTTKSLSRVPKSPLLR